MVRKFSRVQRLKRSPLIARACLHKPGEIFILRLQIPLSSLLIGTARSIDHSLRFLAFHNPLEKLSVWFGGVNRSHRRLVPCSAVLPHVLACLWCILGFVQASEGAAITPCSCRKNVAINERGCEGVLVRCRA